MTAPTATELNTLTLDDMLSDLETLSPQTALFALPPTSPQPSSSQHTIDHLTSFESGSIPSNRKEYVELSHELVASHRTAQRLNSERVSAAQVGLVLPSDRKASDGKGEKLTRTDLLHAKVAELQMQVEAWYGALEQAVGRFDPQRAEATTETARVESAGIESGTHHDRLQDPPSTVRLDPPPSQQPRKQEQALPPATSEEFEDDDPWNDLS